MLAVLFSDEKKWNLDRPNGWSMYIGMIYERNQESFSIDSKSVSLLKFKGIFRFNNLTFLHFVRRRKKSHNIKKCWENIHFYSVTFWEIVDWSLSKVMPQSTYHILLYGGVHRFFFFNSCLASLKSWHKPDLQCLWHFNPSAMKSSMILEELKEAIEKR